MIKKFGTLARNQQALFRETLSENAQSPRDEKGIRNKHLIALDYELENLFPPIRDYALEFFRARNIKWWKNKRSGDSKSKGPTRNLASSQVACVNFLLPLSIVPNGLAAFLKVFDKDIENAITIKDKAENTSPVEFEWVGWDAPLEGGPITRGAVQTSIDAFMIAKIPVGNRAYLFEWKYCEEYLDAPGKYKGKGRSGDTRRKRYQHLYESADSPFNQSIPFDELLYEPFYQIMRLFLLANKMIKEGVSPTIKVNDANVIVVCPLENCDYRNVVKKLPVAKRFNSLDTMEEIVRAGLKKPSKFSVIAPESIFESICQKGISKSIFQEWKDYHSIRYGWTV